MSGDLLLRMTGISKQFPGVQALDKVGFELRAGEVHVLMGENGAGKSTLMKILAGMHLADEGTIEIDGSEVRSESPRDALSNGISMIHQELSAVPHMSVAENIFLGREPYSGTIGRMLGVVDRSKLRADTVSVLSSIGVTIDPGMMMSELSVAEMQMVEIAKATSYNSSIIIMDEPTSAISDAEVERLFTLIESLKNGGRGIVYISHKMDEIYRVSDRITVLRDGKYIATAETSQIKRSELIQMMVGREITDIFPKVEAQIGDVLLEVRDLTVRGVFRNVSFSVRRGEILGVAGLMGAGRTEVVETLFGVRTPTSGEILMDGRPISTSSPAESIRRGIGFVSEDRKEIGLVLKRSVKENVSLVELRSFCDGPFLNRKRERRSVGDSIRSLRIKTPSSEQVVRNLSGGNQQKVVVAKWLLANPDLLIMDEPTRGIDVGAKAEIHRLISELAQQGKAIIMVSSEMPEIIGMSDRVVVMHEGRITGEIDRNALSQEAVMHMATDHVEQGGSQ